MASTLTPTTIRQLLRIAEALGVEPTPEVPARWASYRGVGGPAVSQLGHGYLFTCGEVRVSFLPWPDPSVPGPTIVLGTALWHAGHSAGLRGALGVASEWAEGRVASKQKFEESSQKHIDGPKRPD